MQSITLEINGMSCGHCVRAVQSALSAVPGVTGAHITVGAADVTIDPASGRSDAIAAAAVQAIRAAGYEATVTAGATPASHATPASRGLPVAAAPTAGSCCSPRSA